MRNKVASFIIDVKNEMKKVSWPTRDELIGSSMMVIVMTACLAIYIGICDLILSRAVNFLIR